jgi:hypothetical protein
MRKFWWMQDPSQRIARRFQLGIEAAGAGDGAGGGAGAAGAGAAGAGAGAAGAPQYVTVEDFGKTAAKIRGIEGSLADLSKKGISLDTLVEIGLLEKADDGKYRRPAAQQATPPQQQQQQQQQQRPEDSPLAREVAELRKQMSAKDEELKREREKQAATVKADTVKSALAKAGAVRPERDYVHLLGKVEQRQDGTYFVKGIDKYGNPEEITLDKFCEAFLTENPELMKAQNQPGSGTPAGNGGGNDSKRGKVVPKETWSDMDWYAKNAEKFRTGEFVRGY